MAQRIGSDGEANRTIVKFRFISADHLGVDDRDDVIGRRGRRGDENGDR